MIKFLRKLNPSRYLVLRSTYDRDIAAIRRAAQVGIDAAHEKARFVVSNVLEDAPYVDYVPR